MGMKSETFYNWSNCPQRTKQQVERLVHEFQIQLKPNLIGIYLHGSLATGCFNPQRSDVDLLGVTCRQLSFSVKKSLIQKLLTTSNSPHPIEISFLCLDDLHPWQCLTTFELHFSEDWREKYTNALENDQWSSVLIKDQRDNDLAAHITMTKFRGIVLWGDPIDKVFPDVLHRDYADSIASDLQWTLTRVNKDPVYGVLNACRIYAFFEDGFVLSKEEGAKWALANFPLQFHPVIGKALEAYGSPLRNAVLQDEKESREMLGYVYDHIRDLR